MRRGCRFDWKSRRAWIFARNIIKANLKANLKGKNAAATAIGVMIVYRHRFAAFKGIFNGITTGN